MVKMTLKIKKDNFEKYLKLKKAKVSDIAKELGYTPQFLYMVLNGKRSVSSSFVAKLLKVSGLPFEYFFALNVMQNYQNKDTGNVKFNPKEEGFRCGQKAQRGKLGNGGNHGTTSKTVRTQNTRSTVRIQSTPQGAITNQSEISTKQAGDPATF